uniref:3-oxoacyl-[acyl-carrier-protein] reductase n=1 Tax=Parastrongyloides trichosuri TaxID=131310 RepID=A0A0N4ZI32_PARTI
MKRFQDKVVIVTGGSSGIGKAAALRYLQEGAKVVVVARNQRILHEAVDDFIKAGSKKENILPIECDISDDDAPEKVINKTIDAFGKLDILVNNAGVVGKKGINDEESIELFDHIFKINVRGLVKLSQASLPFLKLTKGNIVNISSIASSVPGTTFLYYRMSKAAVDMFTKSFAGSVSVHGIRVNSVNPGMTATNIFTTMPSVDGKNLSEEEIVKSLDESANLLVPLKRMATPEEVSNVICFVSSDEASYITGSCYVVDGGYKVHETLPNTAIFEKTSTV